MAAQRPGIMASARVGSHVEAVLGECPAPHTSDLFSFGFHNAFTHGFVI
jgi:hypothetical protein